MSNVIAFKPRAEVPPRAFTRYRSPQPAHAFEGPQPLTVEAGITFASLWKALHAGGFALCYDERTRCFLVRARDTSAN